MNKQNKYAMKWVCAVYRNAENKWKMKNNDNIKETNTQQRQKKCGRVK